MQLNGPMTVILALVIEKFATTTTSVATSFAVVPIVLSCHVATSNTIADKISRANPMTNNSC